MVIRDNMAAGSDFQAGFFCQPGIRAHANGQNHHASGQLTAAGQVHGQAITHLLDAFEAIAQVQIHVVQFEVRVHVGRYVVIDRGHDLVQHFHNRDLVALLDQVFGHFQADETAAYHHHVLHGVRAQPVFNRVQLRDVMQHKYTRQVHARQGWHNRYGTWGKQQLVVPFLVDPPVRLFLDGHLFSRAVNRDDLAVDAGFHVEHFLQFLRAGDQQLFALRDDAAQLVGQTAVGE